MPGGASNEIRNTTFCVLFAFSIFLSILTKYLFRFCFCRCQYRISFYCMAPFLVVGLSSGWNLGQLNLILRKLFSDHQLFYALVIWIFCNVQDMNCVLKTSTTKIVAIYPHVIDPCKGYRTQLLIFSWWTGRFSQYKEK